MVKGYARKKGVRIVMDLGAMPAIRCRAARIHQVVVNLLTNAIDACAEEDGVVTVHTETEPEAMGVRIDIQDNGCGIEAAIRERIFDPFFTTKPIGQGTGLGLSISYGIIQEHGGRIEVWSRTPARALASRSTCPSSLAACRPPRDLPLAVGLERRTRRRHSPLEASAVAVGLGTQPSRSRRPIRRARHHETRTDQLGLGPGRAEEPPSASPRPGSSASTPSTSSPIRSTSTSRSGG